MDRMSGPQSLDDLKREGYLREIPTDPITQTKDWDLRFEERGAKPDTERDRNYGRAFHLTLVSKFENTPYNSGDLQFPSIGALVQDVAARRGKL